MKKRNITKSQIDSLRQYRVWVYWSASLSIILLILFIILKTLYLPPNIALISESFDSILFEIMIVCSGAFFSTSLIGIIYEKFQTRIVHDDTLVRERFVDEGILKVYKSATDPNLLDYLLTEIINSKSEFIAIGLGLGILSHNPQLLHAISEKINKVSNYRIRVFLGSSKNEGVKNRIREEKLAHDKMQLNYDETWITRYFSEINSLLKSYVNKGFENKFQVKEIDTCPMISVLKIDDLYVFFPYGTPNIKGSQSPWILVDGEAENSSLVKYLKDIIAYYERP